MSENELRIAIKVVGVRLLDANLVQGTWGNISARLDEKSILVTPSGKDYYATAPEDMVVVDTETCEYDRTGPKPTSERGIHAEVMKNNPAVNAVIHSHPEAGSVFACAHAQLPLKDEADKVLFGCDVIRCAAYGLPGTSKLKQNTVSALGKAKAVFMANHGVLVCGKDLDEAYDVLARLEELCNQTITK